MKAVDTNVLVRYLVQDDPVQGRKAAAYIDKAADAGEQILVGNIVLCEAVWVLDSAYGFEKPDIETAMEKLLQSSTIQFEKKDIVLAAFEDFRKGSMDFADCLRGHVHRSLGCEPTATFDTALRKLPTFQML